ncbi:Transposon Ty3-G Gag-Pol polyprotein [Hypsizygus marmoreus]|uniref:Transposon Ty3-G Gag-Pol polyprotein n=1 Tax=Hypsizygus marmoreus TaxID=39966 RepID=A0A369JVU6_HYPMA|nr:Transposon Ty3-G Gag-Pol polyprotein [Hypsizygus marmoreus]
MRDDEPAIATDSSLNAMQEELYNREPAQQATFVAWDLEDCLENQALVWATRKCQPQPQRTQNQNNHKNLSKEASDEDELSQQAGYEEGYKKTGSPAHLLVEMTPETISKFATGYLNDMFFKMRLEQCTATTDEWRPGICFFKDSRGLLYFRDADFQPWLCVPETMRNEILNKGHEAPGTTAHAGPEKLWAALSTKFYWHRMKRDILAYCKMCDVCQKTKPSNFKCYGVLIPNPIPSQPYESVSLDLIVNLPWSEDSNAILVVVDRMTKHAQFIPTTTGLTANGFGELFVKHFATRFGLPASIITNRDPRWTSDFWKAIASAWKTKMALSSSHHPQHDGQTEIVNKSIETMLRAYVSEDKHSWATWLHLLEYAYNSSLHSSTGASPFFLLYGFEPLNVLDFLTAKDKQWLHHLNNHAEARSFLDELQMHRESARRTVAKAQEKQAWSYDKGRWVTPDLKAGSKVLVNPHSLEWQESKGEGAKLVQRWIGPFEIIQKINPKVYRLCMSDRYPGSPVFNIEHLKPYHESPEDFGVRTQLSETRLDKPESKEYEVEKIVGHKFDKRTKKVQFLVRWATYRPQFDTWRSALDLKNAPLVLKEYKARASI